MFKVIKPIRWEHTIQEAEGHTNQAVTVYEAGRLVDLTDWPQDLVYTLIAEGALIAEEPAKLPTPAIKLPTPEGDIVDVTPADPAAAAKAEYLGDSSAEELVEKPPKKVKK